MLDVTGIAGALQGLSFAGDVRARLDRAVSGRLTITLEPSYLAQGGALAMGAGIIALKRLHPTSMIKIDAASMSFWAVANKTEGDSSGLTVLERQRAKVWLKDAFAEIAKPGV